MEFVSFIFEHSFLGIDGNTAIISHTFVQSRSIIKKRSFAAVRISNQGNIDMIFLFVDGGFQTFFVNYSHEAIWYKTAVSYRFDGNNFYHGSFGTSQGNIVAHNFVLNRILQRCVFYQT